MGTVLPFGVTWISNERKCSTNFLTYYEEAGKALADLIPPGSQRLLERQRQASGFYVVRG